MKSVSASDDEWAFSDDGSSSRAASIPPKSPKNDEEDQEMSENEDGWTAPEGSEDWELDDDLVDPDDDDSSFFSEIAPSDAPSARLEAKEREKDVKGKGTGPKKSVVYEDFEDETPDIGIYCGPWRFLVHEEYIKRGSNLFNIVPKKDPSLYDERARYDIEGLDPTAFELVLHYIYTHEYSKRWLDDEFKVEDLWDEESVYGAAYAHAPHIYFLKESISFITPAPPTTNSFASSGGDGDDDDASSTNTVRLATSTTSTKRIPPAWLNVLVYHQACRYKVRGLKEECIHRFIHHASSEQLASRLTFSEAFTSLFETERDPLHRELRESVIKLCTKCTIEVMTSQTNKVAIQEIAWLLQRSTKYMRHENRSFARSQGVTSASNRSKEWEDEIQQQYSLALAIGISQETFAAPVVTPPPACGITKTETHTWRTPTLKEEGNTDTKTSIKPWNQANKVSWFPTGLEDEKTKIKEEQQQHEMKWGPPNSQTPFSILFARNAEQVGIKVENEDLYTQKARDEIKNEMDSGPVETQLDKYIKFLRSRDEGHIKKEEVEELVPPIYFAGQTTGEPSVRQLGTQPMQTDPDLYFKHILDTKSQHGESIGTSLSPAEQASQTTLVGQNEDTVDMGLDYRMDTRLNEFGAGPSNPEAKKNDWKGTAWEEGYIKEEDEMMK
ncbi:hypothetical protein BJ508DRAFT_411031 [Ascobolus immersus RN42]|uniref:BTB domain-containing protein n=1 Tax=Ascobolus immersus RN42 TaxID=1160509 RepID=A0A3N4IRL3_ASCIM|nr:hypothetical protein BJ508DRAFT_411031 [Ascobolus immersus RN42]